MLRYYYKKIVGIANKEVLADLFTGAEGKSQRVVSIWPEQGATQVVRAYLDNDRVLDFSLESDAVKSVPIPMDLVVPAGSLVRIGFFDESGGAVTSDVNVGVEESVG